MHVSLHDAGPTTWRERSERYISTLCTSCFTQGDIVLDLTQMATGLKLCDHLSSLCCHTCTHQLFYRAMLPLTQGCWRTLIVSRPRRERDYSKRNPRRDVRYTRRNRDIYINGRDESFILLLQVLYRTMQDACAAMPHYTPLPPYHFLRNANVSSNGLRRLLYCS